MSWVSNRVLHISLVSFHMYTSIICMAAIQGRAYTGLSCPLPPVSDGLPVPGHLTGLHLQYHEVSAVTAEVFARQAC